MTLFHAITIIIAKAIRFFQFQSQWDQGGFGLQKNS